MIINTVNLPQGVLNMSANKNIGMFNQNTSQISSLIKIDTPSAIDETMKAKARGLEIEDRYAQEAVAVAQTALEGLEKINNNLEEMKDLVTMATDPMYTDEDRELIQQEIDGLNGSITAIAEGTEYKGHHLLDRESETPETAAPDAAADAPAPESEDVFDLIGKILDDFDSRYQSGLKSFTADKLGTDKVDVSTAESALASLDIVDKAMKSVEEEMKKWVTFKEKYEDPLELSQAKDVDASEKAKLINGAMEMLKYSMLEESSKTLLANSEQNPQKVAYLLK